MKIGRRDVRLTNQDKPFFPEQGLTKGDLVAYYVDVADCVLHHVRRRPMQMSHLPQGPTAWFATDRVQGLTFRFEEFGLSWAYLHPRHR